jgi:hypothetical protein
VIALHQEQEAPRPIYKEAQVYYNDFNAERSSKKFTQKAHEFNFICKATNSSIPITRKEQDLLANISNIIKISPKGLAYLSHAELSNLTGNNKRQNNIMRKNLSHILQSKWKKTAKIDGVVMSKVIIFKYTTNGEVILNNPREYYKKIKAGTTMPISIYKNEKYINNRSIKSNFCNNFNSNIPITNTEPNETRTVVPKKKVLINARKKMTNSQRKVRVYSLKFKQYDKPKNLRDHYPLTTEECLELQSRSGRDFTQNAMNEILLDMSRKPKLQGHSFVSRGRFMAYMATVYRYEGRDALKTSNSSFKIMARATKAEVIAYTTQTQRDEFMATFEQAAIDFPTPENRFKAKIACTLPPMIGYNLLSSIKSISFLNDMLEICLVNQLNIDHHKQAILKEAKAVDCKIDHVLVYCS